MIAGKQLAPIPANVLWDEYYENLHSAYNSMHDAYNDSGLTQDDMACRLDVDKSLISKRMNGRENLTLKSMSYTATAMDCRLLIAFVPYQMVGVKNYFAPTPQNSKPKASSNSGVLVHGATNPVPAGKSKVLEPV